VIILLNGTSSAGKTSIARELQKRFSEPYLHTGIDHFFRMFPPSYLGMAAPADQGFLWLPPRAGSDEGVAITVGPVGQRMIAGYHRAVAALAEVGNNLIVDEVLLDPAWLRDWVAVLAPFSVLFVGVRCPLSVVEQRERERGDRTVGQARGHFNVVHSHGEYDLEVDTSLDDAVTCTTRIIDAISASPYAFARLRESFAEHRARANGVTT
jgi:chloramphenicol 3-O phosphotransferase